MSAVATKARGRPPASQRTAAESRAALLDAAATVFAAKGFRAATVDDVVRAARLSKGTFYWHFPSKDDLFLALVDERLDQPVRELMASSSAASLEESMANAMGAGLAALFVGERDLVLLLHEYWSAAARDEPMAARYRAREDALRRALADALSERHRRSGVPMAMAPDDLAQAFLSLAHGLSITAVVHPAAVPADLFGEVASLIYDGMVLRARG
jgi:AcrR family transcriptional regulator